MNVSFIYKKIVIKLTSIMASKADFYTQFYWFYTNIYRFVLEKIIYSKIFI